jgi:hypothetical protein
MLQLREGTLAYLTGTKEVSGPKREIDRRLLTVFHRGSKLFFACPIYLLRLMKYLSSESIVI